MSETSKDILRFYHEIGDRNVLQYWRNTVPSDVRKIWIRSFVNDVAKDKILSPKYQALFESTLSEATITKLRDMDQAIENYQTRVDNLEKQAEPLDENSEERFQIESQIYRLNESIHEIKINQHILVKNSLTPAALEAFAKAYFTGYQTDPEKQKNFEQVQTEAGSLLAQALSTTLPEIDVVVLAGSGAIGKRPEGHTSQQDLDFFFLPKIALEKRTLEEYHKFLYYIFLIIEKQDPTKNLQDPQISFSKEEIERFSRQIPQWQHVIDFFQQHEIIPDLRIADTPSDENEAWVGDWHKLAGPHTVLARLSSEADVTYKKFLDLACRSARNNEDNKGRQNPFGI